MLNKAKVFVAGGRTGFVGANMTKALLERGATVYAHSRDDSKRSLLPPHERMIEVFGDLSKDATLPPDLDYVFHCAAHTSGAKEMVTNPVAQITVNVFMNSLLLDAAAKSKVKRFVFISSSAVYPEIDEPMKEEMAFQADPPDAYFGPAWMKRFTEKLAQFYYRQYHMEILIIRPSNIYGPYCSFDLERAHVLPALMRKFIEAKDSVEVWGTPNVVRDFIYADDFITGVLRAFEKMSDYEVYNIASGNLYTIGESVDHIKDLSGFQGTVTYNASKPMTIKKRYIDTSKAERDLGFHATTDFRDGLRRTIEWYKSTLNQ